MRLYEKICLTVILVGCPLMLLNIYFQSIVPLIIAGGMLVFPAFIFTLVTIWED